MDPNLATRNQGVTNQLPSTPGTVIDYSAFSSITNLVPFVSRLADIPVFSSQASYNAYCRYAFGAWLSHGIRSHSLRPVEPDEAAAVITNGPTPFQEYAGRLARGQGPTIKTSWGGVVIEKHEHPLVEKYLVVNRSRYLAFEKHAKKIEDLEVRQGYGLLFHRPVGDVSIQATFLEPGVTAHFEPGHEHAILALEDLLIFERSLDFLGMDNDLIFIFTPEA